ncbi:hypothetical protein HDK90DRAFT_515069 [Phyllosticta capitalensis]|uniref:Uncharacterized protein n=1 Tax=Phyllosticta capitalensis TaxID=121624 RepID=A0ABR1YBV8_9PEZI
MDVSMESTVVTEISLHELEDAPGVIEPSIQGNFYNMMMLRLGKDHTAAERLEALLDPSPSTELLPPSRTPATTKSKSKRGRGVIKRKRQQEMVMRPVPTGIPPSPGRLSR